MDERRVTPAKLRTRESPPITTLRPLRIARGSAGDLAAVGNFSSNAFSSECRCFADAFTYLELTRALPGGRHNADRAVEAGRHHNRWFQCFRSAVAAVHPWSLISGSCTAR